MQRHQKQGQTKAAPPNTKQTKAAPPNTKPEMAWCMAQCMDVENLVKIGQAMPEIMSFSLDGF